jgi:PAS domain S-box-containing protein
MLPQATGSARDESATRTVLIGTINRVCRSLSCDGVTVVQPAESRAGVDCALSRTSDRYGSTGWRILRQSEVGPIFMVVAHILGQQALEVLLIQDDHVVEQVASATPHPALCHTVLPRTAKGSAGGLAPQVSYSRNYIRSKFESRSNKRNLCAGTYGHAERSHSQWNRPTGLKRELLSIPSRIVQCNIRDITERARAEAALKISETHHRSVFEGAVPGIYRATLEGRFVEVNPALVAMLGYSSAEEVLQLNLARDVFAEPEAGLQLLHEWQVTGEIEDEVQWKRRDQRLITVRLASNHSTRNSRQRTMWSLSNAFTSACKELDPIPQFKATAKLGAFLSQLPA